MGFWDWLFPSRKHKADATSAARSPSSASDAASTSAAFPPKKNRSKYLLDLRKNKTATAIPAGTTVARINAAGCINIREVPAGISCRELDLSGTSIEALPGDLAVEFRINLTDCKRLESLPQGLKTGTLILRGCTALRELPADLEVSFLDIRGCTNITHIPDDLKLRIGRLIARDCPRLRSIPASLGPIAQLDLAGCSALTSLPQGLVVTSWVDIAGTGITALPESLKGIQLRWRSVIIDERIAFRPQEIAVEEVLAESNAERRRVLLDRVGFERFIAEAQAEELDRDTDAGGQRRLLRVAMKDDEALVCVSVICPSTDRQYLIRVPPTMTTCRQAVAWTAGFDNPDDYQPEVET